MHQVPHSREGARETHHVERLAIHPGKAEGVSGAKHSLCFSFATGAVKKFQVLTGRGIEVAGVKIPLADNGSLSGVKERGAGESERSEPSAIFKEFEVHTNMAFYENSALTLYLSCFMRYSQAKCNYPVKRIIGVSLHRQKEGASYDNVTVCYDIKTNLE